MKPYVGISSKGPGVFFKEWFTAPFHGHGIWAVILAPVNFLFRVIEEAVRPLSLSMRLFGNMYAGELIFLLIACFTLGAALTWALSRRLVRSNAVTEAQPNVRTKRRYVS